MWSTDPSSLQMSIVHSLKSSMGSRSPVSELQQVPGGVPSGNSHTLSTHWSIVQASPSSHSMGSTHSRHSSASSSQCASSMQGSGPSVHTPDTHDSSPLQNAPSSQGVPSGIDVNTQD